MMIYAVYLLFVLLPKGHLQEMFITRTDNISGERVQDGSLFDMLKLNSDFSLFCWYRTHDSEVGTVYWSINNHYESNGKRISTVNVGWRSSSDIEFPYRKQKLFRSQTTAQVEGNLTCTGHRSRNPGNTHIVLQLGIFYPILSILINIHEIDTNVTLQISCTSTGGRPVRMSVSGPSGVVEDNMNIVNVGRAVGTGNDSFTSYTTVHDGRNGDTYTCFATNGISNMSNSLTLGDVRDSSSTPASSSTSYLSGSVIIPGPGFPTQVTIEQPPGPTTLLQNIMTEQPTGDPSVKTPSKNDFPFQLPASYLIALAFLLFGIIVSVVITITILVIFKRCKNAQSKVETVVKDNPAYGVCLGVVDPGKSASENVEYELVEF